MLLALDIGNTNISLALFQGKRIIFKSRFCTFDSLKKIKELLSKIKKSSSVDGVIISSVVPQIDERIRKLVWQSFKVVPVFVTNDLFKGLMQIKVKKPKEVGSDRLVNAFGAMKIYKKMPIIIIDFGTATTFCAVNSNGDYIGGAIAPGINISRDALHEKTAKLPFVQLKIPKSPIGKDTISAMRSGILYGYIGVVKEIVGRFKKILGKKTFVIATGGLAEIISSKTDIIDLINQDLTLLGLNLLWETIWNKKQNTKKN